MSDILVVGESNQFEVFVASREERFSYHDFFFVEGDGKEYLSEVVESYSINSFLPLPGSGNEREERIISHLKTLGFKIEEEEINIAKLRFLDEPPYPLKVGSRVRRANFSEIKHIFKLKPDGLVIGIIKNTDRFYNSLPNEFKDLVEILEEDGRRRQREIPFIFGVREMAEYPHIGIFGGSGSGKSFSLRVIIEEMAKKGYPAIVFDPHFEMIFDVVDDSVKGVYKNIKESVRVFSVGEDIGIDFSELSEGEVESLFSTISEIEPPQMEAIYVAYNMMGKEKSLSKFRENLRSLAERKTEGEIKTNVNPSSARAVLRKLNYLIRLGIFGKGDREVINWMKDKKIAVVWGNLDTLKVFVSFLLRKLVDKRRAYKDGLKKGQIEEYFPPFFVVIDEAHNFAPKEYSFTIPSKRVIKLISQEGRKYGIFLILATQRPSLLDDTITAQLNTKFIFRTVRETDLLTIKKETDLSKSDIERLPYLKSGDCFVSSAIFQRSLPVRIRLSFTKTPYTENPFEELKREQEKKDEVVFSYIRETGLIEENMLHITLKELERRGLMLSGEDELMSILSRLSKDGKIEEVDNGIFTIWKVKDVD